MHKKLFIKPAQQIRSRTLCLLGAATGMAVLWFLSLLSHGYELGGICSLLFIAALLHLSWWDLKTGLLLDVLTYPLIISGLALNAFAGDHALTEPLAAVTGSLAGYGLLWLANAYYLWRTGDEGIGQGDFKLAAGIGAWLGLQAVAGTLIVAAVTGLFVGLVRRRRGTLAPGAEMAFGPFLAAGGLVMLILPNWF